VGLQGKLGIGFLGVVCVALVASIWIFLTESRRQLDALTGLQASNLSTTLALTARQQVEDTDASNLNGVAQDLVKSRNILFVTFLNVDGTSIATASRDLDFKPDRLIASTAGTQSLMRVQRQKSRVFGEYLEVVAPVLSGTSLERGAVRHQKLLGFVAVGVSQEAELAQLRNVTVKVIAIGIFVALTSLPIALLLIHRIFQPIRDLVSATQMIAHGNLDCQVAIHRPDVIGMLARSFNDMILRVKQHQSELADANKGLEAKVLERTAQLEQANGQLSREIDEKEAFLRAVSHDLNAPLRNIDGMATMLLMKSRGKLDDEIIHRLERIKKNVGVQTDLIGELLELSRIKTRRQTIEPVEIGPLVSELRDMFEDDLRTKTISVIVDTLMPVVQCERARLRQVFQNLIDNAIKYMGERPLREIHVGFLQHKTEARFYVRDTGIGIEQDDVEKVFHIFRRGRNVQQQVVGKGVGLASVKSIIETYGGRIWVESTVGVGSTFWFTLGAAHLATLQDTRKVTL